MSSPTVKSQIMAFAAAALAADPPIADLTVNRMRKLIVGRDVLPLMSVYAFHDKQKKRVPTEWDPTSDREFRFVVACYTKGDPVDEALDPMDAWAEQALMADQSFNGLITSLQQDEAAWTENYAGDEVYGRLDLVFAARYAILATDPTTVAG